MKTVLLDKHRALGAKIVDFAGWDMPVHYTGVIQEHLAVRNTAGIFDVSHMGRILVTGKDASNFLDYLSTNKIDGKKDFSATYTVWCNDQGGCVDDVIVYRLNSENFFIIVNASNREKDLAHLKKYAKNYDVQISDRFREDGILAIQGPKATGIVIKLFSEAEALKVMNFLPVKYHQQEIILSKTGYTGSGGFEIYAPVDLINDLWDDLFKVGASEGLMPVGLGARDTLRLEMGYALYGHEINDLIYPSESVSAWTIKWDKKDFLGLSILKEIEEKKNKRNEYGIKFLDKGIPREGYPVYKDGQLIGKVTSGNYSPSLSQAIAIIIVEGKLLENEIVEVQVRDRLIKAQVVKMPFYKKD